MSDVSDEQAVPESEGDPLLVALDQGLGELSRLAEVRDGLSADPDDSTGDRSPASGDAGADEPVAADELARLDEETGQREWREEQHRQYGEFEQFQQEQQLEYAAEQAQAVADHQQGVLADALERLNLALDVDDAAGAWHAADEVAGTYPELLPEFLADWYASDPQASRRYAQALQDNHAQAEAQQWESEQAFQAALASAVAAGQEREAWEQHERLQEGIAEAMKAEVEKFSADPALEALVPTIIDLAATTFEQFGDPQSPVEAATIVRSAYENAIGLQVAKEKAPFLTALDEVLHHQELAADRTGKVPTFDPEAAHARAIAENLEPAPIGATSEARQRFLAGQRPGHGRSFDSDLAAVDELVDHQEATRQLQDEMGAAIDRSRAKREAEKNRYRKPPGTAA